MTPLSVDCRAHQRDRVATLASLWVCRVVVSDVDHDVAALLETVHDVFDLRDAHIITLDEQAPKPDGDWESIDDLDLERRWFGGRMDTGDGF